MNENLREEELTPNLMLVESADAQKVDDRTAFLKELGWKESSRSFDAGKVRAMLEKAA